jgi:hypothetical protein
MSYRDWQVGDKVVCINGAWTDAQNILAVIVGECPLVGGEVYTIAKLGLNPTATVSLDGSCGFPVCVWLQEVSHPQKGYGFNSGRFRKVQPRKTDISIFTAMLNKTGVDA